MGVQSGNTLQLNLPIETLNALGGLPVEITIKPLLDLLATAQLGSSESPFFGLFKGGVAYRQLQVDGRSSIPNLSQFSPEAQIGIGYSVGTVGNISLVYQGIVGGAPNLYVTESCPCGDLANIPTQQGVLLSFSLLL